MTTKTTNFYRISLQPSTVFTSLAKAKKGALEVLENHFIANAENPLQSIIESTKEDIKAWDGEGTLEFGAVDSYVDGDDEDNYCQVYKFKVV